MKKFSKLIILLLLVFSMMIICSNETFAATEEEKEQLRQLFDYYKDEIGDIQKFQEIINNMYSEVENAQDIDAQMKENLYYNISELKNIQGMNELLVETLQSEFNLQVDNLTMDNIQEFKEELEVIKTWIEDQSSSNNGNTNNQNQNNNNGNGNTNDENQNNNNGNENNDINQNEIVNNNVNNIYEGSNNTI